MKQGMNTHGRLSTVIYNYCPKAHDHTMQSLHTALGNMQQATSNKLYIIYRNTPHYETLNGTPNRNTTSDLLVMTSCEHQPTLTPETYLHGTPQS